MKRLHIKVKKQHVNVDLFNNPYPTDYVCFCVPRIKSIIGKLYHYHTLPDTLIHIRKIKPKLR